MLLLTAGFKMQSTQARLTHISLAFLNRPRERDGSGPDDDDGPYFSAVTRDDVPDSAAYYVAGSLPS